MARVSEIHYSNAYAKSSGVSEFVEVALGPNEDPANYTIGFYSAGGAQGLAVGLDDPGVRVRYDEESDELVYTISSEAFPFVVTDPDSGGSNYPAVALADTREGGEVEDFYDWGGGSSEIEARDGVAAGATSQNIAVPTGPQQATYSIQFNQPNPDEAQFLPVSEGESGVICFCAGTRILTPMGERRVESLRAGDLVLTRDNGVQPIEWIGRRNVVGRGAFAPMEIAVGALGACRPLRVSPQHRMLVRGPGLNLAIGETEAFVAAKHLGAARGIARRPADLVTYVHLMFARHEVIWAEGVPTESFFIGPGSRAAMTGGLRAEFAVLFPELLTGAAAFGPLARPSLSRWEALAAGVA